MKRFRKAIYYGLLQFIVIVFSTSAQSQPADIVLGVYYNYSNEYLKVGVNSQEYSSTLDVAKCPELNEPELKNIQRITMDLLLVCNAVRDAGIADRIILQPFPNVARGVIEVSAGRVDMVGTTLFPDDHRHIPTEKLFITVPVTRSGEFEVGVFTTRERDDILKLRHAEDFRKLTGVTVKHWLSDQAAMKLACIKNIETVNKRGAIAKFISAKRGDFTFSYLREPVVTRIGGELIRIDGVKASFPQQRSFIISRDNYALYEALDSCIVKMRAIGKDEIRAAYIHAGFIAPEYKNWINLSENVVCDEPS